MLSLRALLETKNKTIYNGINARFINQFSTNLTHMSDLFVCFFFFLGGGQNGTQIQIQIFCVKSTHLGGTPQAGMDKVREQGALPGNDKEN